MSSSPSPSPSTPPAPAAPPFPPEPWSIAIVPAEAPEGDLRFRCPRCGDETSASAYGPCPPCRSELRARLGGEQREVEQDDYVPKVNVTPNAVALKD